MIGEGDVDFGGVGARNLGGESEGEEEALVGEEEGGEGGGGVEGKVGGRRGGGGGEGGRVVEEGEGRGDVGNGYACDG